MSPMASSAARRPLVSIENVAKTYAVGRSRVRAVDGVSLEIAPGERVGLVGESGSGKSTLARLTARLEKPTAGRVVFDGIDLASIPERELRPLRARFQLVFQDPWSSLDPRQTVGSAVEEGLAIHERGDREKRRALVRDAFVRCGLDPALGYRFPHELSGGERQRVAIARAIILEPDLLILDEAVSSLDVTVQARILELLGELRRTLRVAWLFVSHDLAVVSRMSDRVAVIYRGRIVELGAPADLFHHPLHPYTQRLVDAARRLEDPGAEDEPPRAPRDLPASAQGSRPELQGCSFAPECPVRVSRCLSEAPALLERSGRVVACHLHDSVERPPESP